ncbi:hypothetical protein H2O64_16775 [Kordia sp. YSTF-M3]|uniref:DoxX family membrane protein n=1 Tax=Kordia aestuariivivens TaxID=2759037 RepID=A0ABR7QCP1_9FLAO|nr:hypothetical protein [Kordia aestuariivivens]MBC8756331.1 hypothetical protein [Kordia aestuariivivens]
MKYRDFLEIAFRWYLFLFISIYGLGKIMGGQFYRKGFIPQDVATTPIVDVSSFELAWVFMGHSFAYILFVGVLQLIGAFCLLFKRTVLLGVFILIPILVNIIVFDIIFLDTYAALVNAIVYFLLLLGILYFHKEKIIAVFHILTKRKSKQQIELKTRIKSIAIVIGIMFIIFIVNQTIGTFVGH